MRIKSGRPSIRPTAKAIRGDISGAINIAPMTTPTLFISRARLAIRQESTTSTKKFVVGRARS